jgi:transposase
LLSDAQWSLIASMLPSPTGRHGRPFSDARITVEAIIYRYRYRYRCGIAWRDVPQVFGPWQTVWTWHRRMAADCTWDEVLAVLTARADAAGRLEWSVAVELRSPVPTSTRRTSPATQGARSNYNNPREEPPDHGLGRSRGGLSTKIHHLVDGRGLPLVIAVAAGHANDAPALLPLLAQLRVARPVGRARTRPDRLRGDKAYSSRDPRPPA